MNATLKNAKRWPCCVRADRSRETTTENDRREIPNKEIQPGAWARSGKLQLVIRFTVRSRAVSTTDYVAQLTVSMPGFHTEDLLAASL
jgi:hypothetical protein